MAGDRVGVRVQTYVALLRSVNVGGRKVPMAQLVALLERQGLRSVRTYIQSGNVIFEGAKKKPEAWSALLHTTISSEFGFDVPVVVRTREALQAVLSANPYLQKKTDPQSLHVSFCDRQPAPAGIATLTAGDYGADRCAVVGSEVYLHCPNGYGETKLNNATLERHLKVVVTTRNWRTVNILAEMAAS
jgi:uncharacterized protein (DUF1697 family)